MANFKHTWENKTPPLVKEMSSPECANIARWLLTSQGSCNHRAFAGKLFYEPVNICFRLGDRGSDGPVGVSFWIAESVDLQEGSNFTEAKLAEVKDFSHAVVGFSRVWESVWGMAERASVAIEYTRWQRRLRVYDEVWEEFTTSAPAAFANAAESNLAIWNHWQVADARKMIAFAGKLWLRTAEGSMQAETAKARAKRSRSRTA